MAAERKDVYTTGEAAEICRVSQQTVIRWFDTGRIDGFRIPGSKFRRIPHRSLLRFMRDNNIPMDVLAGAQARVLIVDDDPQIVELLVDVLSADERFEVQTAQTGYDAGVRTQQFRPDVLVLDYMLPDVNGNVVCKTIREDPELAHVKILIVSGVVNQTEIQELLDAGADDFVKKPFNVEQIVERIAKLAKV